MDPMQSNRLAVLYEVARKNHRESVIFADQSFGKQMFTAETLWEARKFFQANQDFSQWLTDSGANSWLSEHDRAGYIWMAKEPDLAHEAHERGRRSPRKIGEYIRAEIEKRPPSCQGCQDDPVETNISETTVSVPPEAVTVIPPTVKTVSTIETTPTLTQPSNSVPVLATKHVQPAAVTRKPSTRRHPIETYYKDKTISDTMFALWGKRGNHSSVTISRLSEKPANRPMVLKMVETIKANNWTPIQGAQGLTPSLLHSALRGKGTTYKETPSGIQACIDEALQLDRKVRGEVDPEVEARQREAYEAMLVRLKASTAPTSVPTDAGERFNMPASDEAIVVYGKVIREKGAHPEVYQDWWQGASLIFHILEVFGPLKPDQLRNVGHTLSTARHWLRGIDVYQLELVLGEIGNAMLAAKDETGRLISAPARVRHADK